MKKSEEATISEGNNGVDRISQLPDDVLHRILSGLESTEEVFRTTILSKRWNGLWTSVPKIDIDYFRGGPEPLQISDLNKSAKFVDTVLANRSVDLDTFRLCCLNFYDMATIGRWIHAALTRNVKRMELLFYSKDESEYIKDIKLLECPVNCDSLKELRLYVFGYPLKLPYFAEFQAVRVLVLTRARFLYNISSDCFTQLKNLEDLSLINCYMHGSKFASCPNLTDLKIVNMNYDSFFHGEIRINCPKLVFLELTGQIYYDVFVDNPNSLKKAVIHRDFNMEEEVSYVDLFDNISGVESLSIGLYFLFQFIKKGNIIPPLPNLKTLEITTSIDLFTMDVLRQFLIHPNLDSIHLIIQQTTFGLEYWKLEESETMKILTRHLKRVEFDGFNGKNERPTMRVLTRHPKRTEFDGFAEDANLEIARYLLEHGSKLEEMVFKWNNNSNYQNMSMKTMEKVSNFHKASSNVKLMSFFKD